MWGQALHSETHTRSKADQAASASGAVTFEKEMLVLCIPTRLIVY